MSILHKKPRRLLVACLSLLAANAVAAQPYPSKPVRVIVPSVAGGGLDALARVIAQKLNEKLGASFIVDNRPGAGGTIGIEAASRAAPDGYTLIIISATHTATATLQGKAAYDLQRDFSPVVWATTQPYIVNVNPHVSARTVKELIRLAKANPGTINYGSPGAGSAQHLAGVLLSSMTGAKFFHIPYKGGAQVVNDAITGQIQMSFTNYLVCKPHIDSGKLRALAVTTARRSKALPDLPAVSETVPGYDADNWYGMIAPAKTPPKILAMLYRETSATLQSSGLKQRLAAEATEVVSVSRSDFGRHIASEVAKWGEVIRKAGITTQ